MADAAFVWECGPDDEKFRSLFFSVDFLILFQLHELDPGERVFQKFAVYGDQIRHNSGHDYLEAYHDHDCGKYKRLHMSAAFALKEKVKEPQRRGKSDQTNKCPYDKKDDERVIHGVNPKDSRGAVAHVGEYAFK